MNLKSLIKTALPIAASTLAPSLAPGMNPFLSRALASGVGSLLMGGKPKDALLAGALGAGVGALFPGQQAGAEQMSGSGTQLPIGPSGKVSVDQMAKNAVENVVKGGAGTGAANTVAPVAADTMSAKLLESLGADKDNFLFKILNSQLGEGVAAGLVAQLLAGDDDDEVVGEFERRPFGAGGPGGKIGGINYAQGGAVPSLMALSEASRQMADNVRQLTTGATGMSGPRMPTMGAFGGPEARPAMISTMPTPTVMGGGSGAMTQGGGAFESDYGRGQSVFQPAVSPFSPQNIRSGLFSGLGQAIPYKDGGEAKNKNNQPSIMDVINKFKTIQTPFGSGVTREQRLELLKRLGMVQTAKEGGEMSFPRRNGGIDPAEGSGTKDDVPAMLMAGEFVMTRDAVKGMGDGNLRKGIDRMYGMMDNLERMA